MSLLITPKSLSVTTQELDLIKREMADYQPNPNVVVPEGYTNDTSPEVYTYLESL